MSEFKQRGRRDTPGAEERGKIIFDDVQHAQEVRIKLNILEAGGALEINLKDINTRFYKSSYLKGVCGHCRTALVSTYTALNGDEQFETTIIEDVFTLEGELFGLCAHFKMCQAHIEELHKELKDIQKIAQGKIARVITRWFVRSK